MARARSIAEKGLMMRLYYRNKRGEQKSIELTEKPLTIGRSGDADVLILDEKASRVHCGIRFWDGDFYIKDLKSKNGTFVNDKQIDITFLGKAIRSGLVLQFSSTRRRKRRPAPTPRS